MTVLTQEQTEYYAQLIIEGGFDKPEVGKTVMRQAYQEVGQYAHCHGETFVEKAGQEIADEVRCSPEWTALIDSVPEGLSRSKSIGAEAGFQDIKDYVKRQYKYDIMVDLLKESYCFETQAHTSIIMPRPELNKIPSHLIETEEYIERAKTINTDADAQAWLAEFPKDVESLTEEEVVIYTYLLQRLKQFDIIHDIDYSLVTAYAQSIAGKTELNEKGIRALALVTLYGYDYIEAKELIVAKYVINSGAHEEFLDAMYEFLESEMTAEELVTNERNKFNSLTAMNREDILDQHFAENIYRSVIAASRNYSYKCEAPYAGFPFAVQAGVVLPRLQFNTIVKEFETTRSVVRALGLYESGAVVAFHAMHDYYFTVSKLLLETDSISELALEFISLVNTDLDVWGDIKADEDIQLMQMLLELLTNYYTFLDNYQVKEKIVKLVEKIADQTLIGADNAYSPEVLKAHRQIGASI